MRILALGLVLLVNVVGGCGSKEAPRPNVLLISIDSLRRDLVGAYGFESPFAPGVSSSPALDALALEGALFENAYATTSWTLPSHLTMLTGQPELVHGVDIDYHVADPSRRLLAERLSAVGYRTAGFFSGPYLDPDFGFGRGFERYEACYGPALREATRAKAALEAEIERSRRGAVGTPTVDELTRRMNDAILAVENESHRDVSSRTVTDAALAELEAAAAGDRPFFLFAHLFDPHYDYVPPPPHDRTFDADYTGAITGLDLLEDPAISHPDPRATGPGQLVQVANERDMQHIRALYAGELAWVDEQLRRVLERLDALGLAESTLVIVTSDHGDEFFEHGSLGHRNTLFEEITQVPLIVRWPGRVAAGTRIAPLASTVDLVPTVLDWLRLADDTSGTSLVPLLEGREDPRERAVLGRMVRAWNVGLMVPDRSGTPQSVAGQLVVLTESYHWGSLKLLRERSWPRLPNAVLDALPREARDRFEAQQALGRATESLRWIDLAVHPDERPENFSTDFSSAPAQAALERWRERYVDLNADRLAAIEAGGVAVPRDTSEHNEQLRALGYAGGELDSEPLPPGEFSLPAPGH
ncbi:MAG: sulfatase [Planctomycetota bacterium]